MPPKSLKWFAICLSSLLAGLLVFFLFLNAHDQHQQYEDDVAAGRTAVVQGTVVGIAGRNPLAIVDYSYRAIFLNAA